MVRLTKKEPLLGDDREKLLFNNGDANHHNNHHKNTDFMMMYNDGGGGGRPIDRAAFQNLRESFEYIDGISGVNETDLIFLKGLMDSPIMKSLVKVQDKLEDFPKLPKPLTKHSVDLLKDLKYRCARSKTKESKELAEILKDKHLEQLFIAHDQIARYCENNKKQVPLQQSEPTNSKTFQDPVLDKDEIEEVEKQEENKEEENMGATETIRMVGVRKKAGEPLGLTVHVDSHNNLVIARIIEGGMIEKQGLLHKGDVILEVNGTEVASAEDLQTEVAKAENTVTFKVGQIVENGETHEAITALNGNGLTRSNGNTKQLTCYMRALYEYLPEEDTLLPCKEIGLQFTRGDILQIVDQRDPNWWQAKLVGGDGRTGLIPSLELEERRKAFVAPEADYVHKISICGARISKKKKKIIYQSKSNCDFDKAELLLYEEVTRMPPFKRKTLVLIGTQGVGRRTLKNRLINSDPEKFGGVVPYTTRPQRVLEENGQSYWFTDRETMESDIKKSKFLEYGEYNGQLYGTHLDTIRDIIKQGKMCVLDCSPIALKTLHNSAEFLPYVIFIASPGMEQLKSLYDISKSNSNLRYSSRNLTFDRQSSIRCSSRRARTLESLASLYEEEDLKKTLEESASLQRTYDKYIDQVIVNNDFDTTFREIADALEALTIEDQWVPVNWIY